MEISLENECGGVVRCGVRCIWMSIYNIMCVYIRVSVCMFTGWRKKSFHQTVAQYPFPFQPSFRVSLVWQQHNANVYFCMLTGNTINATSATMTMENKWPFPIDIHKSITLITFTSQEKQKQLQILIKMSNFTIVYKHKINSLIV